MTDWQSIWERKGHSETGNLRELDGFENTDIDEATVAREIISFLQIEENDKVLEIGCGAGMIAQFLYCRYVGIDYSRSLIEKHKKLLNNNDVFHCYANELPFDDRSFDKVFCYSVFHYFPDKEYSLQVIKEMKRVCKKCIFIGDLPMSSHRNDHLLFNPEDFSEWIVSKGLYNQQRFNVLLEVRSDLHR